MESGFSRANSSNLPKVDSVMLCLFFGANTDFCSAEYRNIKTSKSARASYGDDAIGYVQLRREGKLCTVKCKICPEHKMRSKQYAVTMVIDEEDNIVQSLECHDCVASQGGCKHAIAFLTWVHRRSEEPSPTSVDCYWKKSKLASVGTGLKFITVRDLSKSRPPLPSNSGVLTNFLEEAQKKNLTECELINYQPDSIQSETKYASMHQLVYKYKEQCCEKFLSYVKLSEALLKKVEKDTREQHKSSLWYELRYGRVTASKAYEISRCKTFDGSLISIIMGGNAYNPETPAMKHGRMLEDAVRKVVEAKLGKGKINKCGLLISPKYPMIAGSPDGICGDSIIEIKWSNNRKLISKLY